MFRRLCHTVLPIRTASGRELIVSRAALVYAILMLGDSGNRVFSHTQKGLFPVPFPKLGFSASTGSGACRLAAPTRRQNDADRAGSALIAAASSGIFNNRLSLSC
jgi:hypothetical protein